jgi:hypothetical protein
MSKRRWPISIRVYRSEKDLDKVELFRRHYASRSGIQISRSEATLLLLRQVFRSPNNEKIFGRSFDPIALDAALPEIRSPQEIAAARAKKEELEKQQIRLLGSALKESLKNELLSAIDHTSLGK